MSGGGGEGFDSVSSLDDHPGSMYGEFGDISSAVGRVGGQIVRFEQLGEWTIMDVANSVGIYLDEGSFIKIKRKLCYLPPVDTSTGWLSSNHFFGYDSKIDL